MSSLNRMSSLNPVLGSSALPWLTPFSLANMVTNWLGGLLLGLGARGTLQLYAQRLPQTDTVDRSVQATV